MNNPVAFDQDTDAPDGVGTFHFEDGSSLYAKEPDLARRVRERMQQTQVPDPRLAQNAHAPRAGVTLRDRSHDPFAGFNETRSDAAPPGSAAGPPGAVLDLPAAANFGESPYLAQPKPEPAQAPQPTAAEYQTLFKQLGPGGPAPSAPTPRQPPPRPMVAGRNPAREAELAVPVPTKSTITTEGQGAPYSQADFERREQLNARAVEAKLAEFSAQKSRAEAEHARYAAMLPSLRQQEAEQNAQLSRLDAVYKHERATVQDHIAEFDKHAKPDATRFFKNAGTLANIGMIISQALGAYSAIVGHTDNFAQRTVEEALQRDYQQQLDEIKEGRVSQGNMLARLRDQLGDLDQARSALKLIHDQVVDREIRSYEAAAQSQDVTLAANTWLAQRAIERENEEAAFRDKSIGKRTTTINADMVVPRAARPMTDEELIAKQTKDNRARAGLLESENEIGYQRQGGEQAGKLAKRKGEEGANAELYVEGFGQAKTKQEAIAVRSAIAEHEAREKMLDRMGELNHQASTVFGIGPLATESNVEAEGLRNRFVTSIARSYGGPITESDTKRAEAIAPDASSLFTDNQDVKIRTAREESRNKLNADLRAIVSGKHPELPELRKEGEK